MKKIISFILVLVMIMSLVACASSETGKEKDKKFNVHYEVNGGSSIVDTKTDKITSAPNPSKAGNVFGGWYLDSAFSTPAEFPMELEEDVTLYAKWLCMSYTDTLKDQSLKFGALSKKATVAKDISPDQFKYDDLKKKGYDTVVIEVTYTVYYEKDHNGFFEYAGPPPYTAVILESDFDIDLDRDLELDAELRVIAPEEPTTETMEYEISFDDLEDKKVVLVFNTINVQNIVYIEDIEIEYKVK